MKTSFKRYIEKISILKNKNHKKIKMIFYKLKYVFTGIVLGFFFIGSFSYAASEKGTLGELFNFIARGTKTENGYTIPGKGIYRLDGKSIEDKTVTNYELADDAVNSRVIQNNSIVGTDINNKFGLLNKNISNELYTTANFGIGTVNPSQKLHVNGNIYLPFKNKKIIFGEGHDSFEIFKSKSGETNGCGYSCLVFRGIDRGRSPANTDFLFGSYMNNGFSALPILKIDGANKNVGIGKVNIPANRKLDVAGDIYMKDKKVATESYVDKKIESTDIQGYFNRKWVKNNSPKEHHVYYNDKNYPIEISVSTGPIGYYNHCSLKIYIGEKLVFQQYNNNESHHKTCGGTITIPPKTSYEISADGWKSGKINYLYELK